MRLVTFSHQGQERLGAQVSLQGQAFILDLHAARPDLPADMLAFLQAGPAALERARQALAGAPLAALLPQNEITLLAPVPHPGKILCIGHNYAGHVGLGRSEAPEYPNFFCKTANTLVGPGQPLVIPAATAQADFEAELMAVIGRQARRISEEQARDCVAGYTIFNDASARDYQKRTSQWLLGKSFDTFGPMGPALVTTDEIPDPYNLDMELTVNGQPRQRINTGDMVFTIPYLIAYLSQGMTLEPGDVIATGTPAKLPEAAEPPQYLRPGDVVRITITGLGELVTPVMAEMIA